MGESDSDDDDDEFPRLRVAPKMGEGAMVWVGRTRGESDTGSWAVRRTGGIKALTAGDGVPLSCCLHSEEQYSLEELVECFFV
jgi:hypothetical protein